MVAVADANCMFYLTEGAIILKTYFEQGEVQFTRVQRLSDGRAQRVHQEGLVPCNL